MANHVVLLCNALILVLQKSSNITERAEVQESAIVSIVAQTSKISEVKLCKEMQDSFKENFNSQTIRNTIHKLGYDSRVNRQKALLEFTKPNINQPEEFCTKLLHI